MFPEEILIIIINFINEFKSFKNFRLTDKFNYNICMNIWRKLNIKLNFYPKVTFVNINQCMVCKKYIKTFNKLCIKFKPYPRPIYIFCNNLKCVNSVMTSFFVLSYRKNIIYLYNKNEVNNNSKKLCKYYRIKNNKIHIHHEYIKDKKFYFKNYLVNKNNYKILSWYRNYKNFDINHINKLLFYLY
jgi:hypothetical protein